MISLAPRSPSGFSAVESLASRAPRKRSLFKGIFAVLSAAVLTVAASGQAFTLQLNFGNSVAATGWNNVTVGMGTVANSQLNNLVNSAGVTTTVNLTIVNPFNSLNTDGPQSYAGLPAGVSASSLFGNSIVYDTRVAVNPTFTLSNLDQNFTYSFTLYASRVGGGLTDTRSGLYTVTGENSANGVINATNNTSTTLQLLNIKPDANGTITFDMKADASNNNANKFFYLNALSVTATPIPEPASAATLAGSAVLMIFCLRRRR